MELPVRRAEDRPALEDPVDLPSCVWRINLMRSIGTVSGFSRSRQRGRRPESRWRDGRRGHVGVGSGTRKLFGNYWRPYAHAGAASPTALALTDLMMIHDPKRSDGRAHENLSCKPTQEINGVLRVSALTEYEKGRKLRERVLRHESCEPTRTPVLNVLSNEDHRSKPQTSSSLSGRR